MRLLAHGQISFSIYVDCPHCEEQFDLIDDGTLNEEGEWTRKLSDFLVNKFEADKPKSELDCPLCHKEILLTKLEY